MDIACPNCAATYRVPDSLLAQGKALRCAACGHQWVPEVPGTTVQPAAPLPMMETAASPARAEGESEDVAPSLAIARPVPPTSPPPLKRRHTSGIRPVALPQATVRPAGRLLPLAWMASVTFILLVLLAMVFFGESIAAAWPPFGRFNALISG